MLFRSGSLTHYCRLRVALGKENALQNFYITNLGKDRIILGYPFLRQFNPRINWVKGKLKKGPLRIESAWFRRIDTFLKLWQYKAAKFSELKEGEAVYVRRTTISQEMAKQHKESQPQEDPPVIPEEFQKYKTLG